MLKARANRGASGENAIVQTVKHTDMIIGPIGIISQPLPMLVDTMIENCLEKLITDEKKE
jgi:hypothetical protein